MVAGVPLVHAGAAAILVAIGGLLLTGTPTPIDLALLAVAFLVALGSPPAAVAAVLVALPLAFRPVAIGDAAFAPTELAIGTSAIGLAGQLARSVATPAGRARIRALAEPLAVSAPAVLFLLAATVSLATVADPGYRRESLREYRLVIVEPLVFFLAARWVLRDAAVRRLVAATFVLAGVVIAAVALVQVALRSGGVVADESYRARAAYPHPNNLAFYLERVGVFAAGYAVAAWPALRAWPALVAAVLVLAGGVATLSRGLLLAVIAGFGVVVALVGCSLGRSRRVWLAYGAGVAVATVAFGLAAGQRLLAAGGDGEEPTRFLIWRASWRMAQDHPVFGVGLDQFLPQYGRRYVEPAGWPERFTSHPHNLALDLWLRVGILGAAAFAWLVAASGRLAARWRSAGVDGEHGLAVGAAGALAAGFAHGLVDNGFFLPDLAIMTWFFIALLEAAPVPGGETSGPAGDG